MRQGFFITVTLKLGSKLVPYIYLSSLLHYVRHVRGQISWVTPGPESCGIKRENRDNELTPQEGSRSSQAAQNPWKASERPSRPQLCLLSRCHCLQRSALKTYLYLSWLHYWKGQWESTTMSHYDTQFCTSCKCELLDQCMGGVTRVSGLRILGEGCLRIIAELV